MCVCVCFFVPPASSCRVWPWSKGTIELWSAATRSNRKDWENPFSATWVKTYLYPPRGAKWMGKGAIFCNPLGYKQHPIGGSWYENTQLFHVSDSKAFFMKALHVSDLKTLEVLETFSNHPSLEWGRFCINLLPEKKQLLLYHNQKTVQQKKSLVLGACL